MNLSFSIPLGTIVLWLGAYKEVRFVGSSGYYLSDPGAKPVENLVPGEWVAQLDLQASCK